MGRNLVARNEPPSPNLKALRSALLIVGVQNSFVCVASSILLFLMYFLDSYVMPDEPPSLARRARSPNSDRFSAHYELQGLLQTSDFAVLFEAYFSISVPIIMCVRSINLAGFRATKPWQKVILRPPLSIELESDFFSSFLWSILRCDEKDGQVQITEG